MPKRIKRNTINAHFENNGAAGSSNHNNGGNNTSIGINSMNSTQKLNKQQLQTNANSAGKPLKMSASNR